jgi:hypothetical protein
LEGLSSGVVHLFQNILYGLRYLDRFLRPRGSLAFRAGEDV